MTRTTLLNTPDFSLHAQVSSVVSPSDGFALTITSQRQEVRRPGEEHVKFFACLDRQGLKALADLIYAEVGR
jgi:hypothetical protein